MKSANNNFKEGSSTPEDRAGSSDPPIHVSSLIPLTDPRSSLPPPPYKFAATSQGSVIPKTPRTAEEDLFRSQLFKLSDTPLQYENPGLLDEALALLPLDRIYDQAEEDSQLDLATAMSLDGSGKPLWGYHDFVIRAIMR